MGEFSSIPFQLTFVCDGAVPRKEAVAIAPLPYSLIKRVVFCDNNSESLTVLDFASAKESTSDLCCSNLSAFFLPNISTVLMRRVSFSDWPSTDCSERAISQKAIGRERKSFISQVIVNLGAFNFSYFAGSYRDPTALLIAVFIQQMNISGTAYLCGYFIQPASYLEDTALDLDEIDGFQVGWQSIRVDSR